MAEGGSSSRPLVGITTYVVPAAWSDWQLEAALVPWMYVAAVERAGARAVLVPPSPGGGAELLDVLDGIVFSGGSDLDPDLYGQAPHPETGGVVAERDEAELALLRAALARDLPVLAICRGSQLLNVAQGGDLVQHLPEIVGHEEHRHTPGVFAEHDVELEPGTRLASALGARALAKSHHHQGFGRIGAGLRVGARAHDGTVEAVERPDRRFALGVLWHPEADAGDGGRLFDALVAAARSYRADASC